MEFSHLSMAQFFQYVVSVMRELTATIRFASHCLGNVKHTPANGRPYFTHARNESTKCVMFMPHGWHAGFRIAADVLCRHQTAVRNILPRPEVVGEPRPIPSEFYRRFGSKSQGSKSKFVSYEAFFPGQSIEASFIVPDEISDHDFELLLTYVGKYCGLSPGSPRESGFFEVAKVQQVARA